VRSKGGDQGILTSHSNRLFQSLSIRHPVARILLGISENQLRMGDGGLFTIAFATKQDLHFVTC
jgi:hypothetical protein